MQLFPGFLGFWLLGLLIAFEFMPQVMLSAEDLHKALRRARMTESMASFHTSLD